MTLKERAKVSNEDNPDTAWFENRLRDLGISQAQAAAFFDLKPYMVRRMMVGDRGMRPGEIVTWAKLLKVSPITILRRLGLTVDEPTVPIIGVVREDGRVSDPPHSWPERIESPEEFPGNMVALSIEAPHSAVSYMHGSTLYYVPSEVVRPDAFGRLSVIELGDSPAPIVGRLDRATVGKGKVIVFGDKESIESRMVISAAPVRWIKAG